MSHPLEIVFQSRIKEDCYSTAYPWKKEDWAKYLRPGKMRFKGDGGLSFYIHIPFCINLCRFCEYTRCLVPSEEIQRNYLQIVENDIQKFLSEYPDITLEGFDIGGGTPTALSPGNFEYLMRIYKDVINHVDLAEDYEPSIEVSFKTITPETIRMIYDAGFRRISIGIQSLSFSRLQDSIGWKYPEAEEIINCVREIRKTGQIKINLDFMYGFRFQESRAFENLDRVVMEELKPDQVTLYELRTNQLGDFWRCSYDHRQKCYDSWYDNLRDLGYIGRYGQNTFSLDLEDAGVSSYIRHRMFEGNDYKGFGISAQSMSDGNIEYNIGKNIVDIQSLIPTGIVPKDASFEAREHYELTIDEKFAKFVCISAYSGGFNWRIAKERFYPDFFERFGAIIDFLEDRKDINGVGEIEISGGRINVTRNGFAHYGPLLFLVLQTATHSL